MLYGSCLRTLVDGTNERGIRWEDCNWGCVCVTYLYDETIGVGRVYDDVFRRTTNGTVFEYTRNGAQKKCRMALANAHTNNTYADHSQTCNTKLCLA